MQACKPFVSVTEAEFARMSATERAAYIEALIAHLKTIQRSPPDSPLTARKPAPGADERELQQADALDLSPPTERESR